MSVILVIVAVAVIVAVVRLADPQQRPVALRRAGFTLMAVFTSLFGAFIVGETFTDPGGWQAIGLVAAWAVPLLALSALAWLRPDWAVYVFAVLTAALVAMSIWFAASPQAWRSFEDRHGPVRTITTFVVVAAVALLGLKRTAAAGALLLAATIVPVALASLGSRPGLASLAAVGSPPAITGVLYLLSEGMRAGLHRRGRPHATPPVVDDADRRRQGGKPVGEG